VNPACPVCHGGRSRLLAEIDDRAYWRCVDCMATFLDPAQRPSRSAERAEYDRHQNDIEDSAYRAFLQPAADAVTQRLATGTEVLDYGCGPGPALAAMLAERGYRVNLFDPIYHPDRGVLQRRYDAITCTEVVEHFHDPAGEFQRIHALLKPGGYLIVMTRFQTDDARFARWHYRRDPTHVVFYRPETFEGIGHRLNCSVVCQAPQLAILRKSMTALAAK
jgi:cyclopropane fatty-acyl-phospholipid synthase-like methyltransferase